MKYGLIGERLSHSFSKEIHARIAPYSYELCEIQPSELEGFAKKRDFNGINVTIPYKQTIIPFLDHVEKNAMRIGAVNTVVKRGDELFGYNTDYDGAAALIRHTGIDIKGKSVMILGTGGTSHTLRHVVSDMGCSETVIVSRNPSNSEISYDDTHRFFEKTNVIINTTPVGMYPSNDSAPIDIAPFKALCGVIDVIYNPLRTRLIQAAISRGIKAEGGLYMLVAQAVYASAHFFENDVDTAIIDKIYNIILSEKENIVLTGMPSSGKSTVGKALSSALSRELIDTDELIVERTKKPITEIFHDNGESAFRSIESEVIADKSKKQGLIISSGGGAILSDKNIQSFTQNGKIYFLDRPLELLISTSDRPLSTTREALEKRYNERYERYCKTADVHINANGTIDEVKTKILEDFKK